MPVGVLWTKRRPCAPKNNCRHAGPGARAEASSGVALPGEPVPGSRASQTGGQVVTPRQPNRPPRPMLRNPVNSSLLAAAVIGLST